jgi:hypothetical protein
MVWDLSVYFNDGYAFFDAHIDFSLPFQMHYLLLLFLEQHHDKRQFLLNVWWCVTNNSINYMYFFSYVCAYMCKTEITFQLLFNGSVLFWNTYQYEWSSFFYTKLTFAKRWWKGAQQNTRKHKIRNHIKWSLITTTKENSERGQHRKMRHNLHGFT